MSSVSAVVLARNNAQTIEPCIKSILPAVDRVIVVDTGSVDDTVHIARNTGASIVHFPWCDDFAAARNFGDDVAGTEWVIHVDSDEMLRPENITHVRQLCAHYYDHPHPVAISLQLYNILDDSQTVANTERIHRTRDTKWHGIIHEHIVPKDSEQPLYTVYAEIGVIHVGYHSGVADMSVKSMRNIRLLHKGLEMNPDDPHYNFFIGRDYLTIGKHESALPYLYRTLELFEQSKTEYNMQMIYQLLIKCHEELGHSDEVDHFRSLQCLCDDEQVSHS